MSHDRFPWQLVTTGFFPFQTRVSFRVFSILALLPVGWPSC